MKRLIVAGLALMLVFSATACSKTNQNSPGNTRQTTTGGGTTQQATTGIVTTQQAISGTLDNRITQLRPLDSQSTQESPLNSQSTQKSPLNSQSTQKSPLNSQSTQKSPQGNYQDGIYTGAGDKWEYGSEDASVMTENGKITSIVLRRLDTSGKEVNYDDWTGKEIDGKVYPNLKQARLDMSVTMLEKQSPDVDTISGATISSTNWKTAVQRALEKAKK